MLLCMRTRTPFFPLASSATLMADSASRLRRDLDMADWGVAMISPTEWMLTDTKGRLGIVAQLGGVWYVSGETPAFLQTLATLTQQAA